MNSLNTTDLIEVRLDRIEQENAQLKSQFKHERRRYRIQATLGLAALGCALFFSPGNRAAFAQSSTEVLARIVALENKTQYLSVDATGDTHLTGTNLHIENGTGQTETPNGKGNLILGYNYSRTQFNDNSDNRSGSHYLILGDWNNYTQHGGIVGGEYNQADGICASVLGGNSNSSDGYASVAIGGYNNRATGDRSVVVSGQQNEAVAANAVVVSGEFNDASGSNAVVVSGHQSQANGPNDVVVSGYYNYAAGQDSALLGGWGNEAVGDFSTVSAGLQNLAVGMYSTVSGGEVNRAQGQLASISGGGYNFANAQCSTVSGGVSNRTDQTAGGPNNGLYSTISGGANAVLTGNRGWIVGNH